MFSLVARKPLVPGDYVRYGHAGSACVAEVTSPVAAGESVGIGWPCDWPKWHTNVLYRGRVNL
jgi:hypothetical protein